eukprot:CAMPEP_0206498512 /NCGR_PEP_ID=MMETSP0324_2-20121206/51055_1 /ASSEMBLY_ACC=CAM_ASM_000836 /TAXON_ID=2866 /ORGANISM="Crypthecodinium cohnii, Strain Seligo" /LENGTH=54 /DNA_ID=CAMNT_0053984747 /DNA_START=99 /DNA_END=260 /DNA_ORIENTATION=+
MSDVQVQKTWQACHEEDSPNLQKLPAEETVWLSGWCSTSLLPKSVVHVGSGGAR